MVTKLWIMIVVKTKAEIEVMAKGAKILAQILQKLSQEVRVGVSTKRLDGIAEGLILGSGGKPNFKGYGGFPASICTSINDEVVHSVPSDRSLESGDIITLDIGAFFLLERFVKDTNNQTLFPHLKNGFHTDMAATFPVGEISRQAKELSYATKESLMKGIDEARAGNTFGDVGSAIEKYAKSKGFNVVRNLCGHGIGRELHEDPEILNYGNPGTGSEIREGMVFCLEPMLTVGDWHLIQATDGSFKTRDGSLSAHFEHMVAVTEEGPRILSLP